MVHPSTALDLIPRRPISFVLQTMSKPSKMLQASVPVRKPLRPRPVSQLSTPRRSSHLRIAVSVESMLRQSGAAAKKHTLHQPQLAAAPRVFAAVRHAMPAYIAGAATLACAGLMYYTRSSKGPIWADGRDASNTYTYHQCARNFPPLAFFCTDQLQIVKDMAQVGPM